jgi:hypothetical protein
MGEKDFIFNISSTNLPSLPGPRQHYQRIIPSLQPGLAQKLCGQAGHRRLAVNFFTTPIQSD